jgi:hypothetical protein
MEPTRRLNINFYRDDKKKSSRVPVTSHSGTRTRQSIKFLRSGLRTCVNSEHYYLPQAGHSNRLIELIVRNHMSETKVRDYCHRKGPQEMPRDKCASRDSEG